MPKSLLDLLRNSVRRRPQAEAVVLAERRFSYAQLWSGVENVAARLRQEGLKPGDRVALLLDATPEYVAAYYGILAAGGVVVALNTAAGAAEITACLRHCEARFVIGDGRCELQQAPAHCQWLDLAKADIWSGKGAPALLPVGPESDSALASIIYTSGTTGAPKGVMLSHRNLVSNVVAVADYLQLTAADRVLHALPFHYSYGNSVLHTHLAVGATVLIEPGLAYPHRVLERMARERTSGFSGVPASFALLLARVQLDAYPLHSLRYLTQAGGPMAPADIERVRGLLPQTAFFVMYGQTEATARLTYLPPHRVPDKPGSVGVAIADTQIRIVDDHANALPAGQAGHVCARGPGVMLGYWNDPDATRRVLRDGWLWTGDLGYLDDDGFLYLQGRSSDLIKTGAHRISPREIEEVLLSLDEVGEAVAAGVPDPLLGEVIKVWLVMRPGASLSARQVLAHCRHRLPLYKVPRHVVFIDAIPKTASGKVRRNVVVNLDVSEQGEPRNVNANESAVEQGCSGAG